MTDNVSQFPARDLVAEMTGPKVLGARIMIEGRVVPKMVMIDHGAEVEFILDDRLSYSFPRELAWLAASFAFDAMAVGAGFPSPAGLHFTQRPFGTPVMNLADAPPRS